MRVITMGSLFDGIGGFPLAAIHNGVVPLWASEIEAFPIRVTAERLPGMLHYGCMPASYRRMCRSSRWMKRWRR